MKCTRCGSYAINPNNHGRDKTDLDLCDVCYWRKRAESRIQIPATELSSKDFNQIDEKKHQ